MSFTGSTPQSAAELKVVVKWQQRWADGHGEYLHTGHEGARTCQEIFCHHSLRSDATVSQAVWHIRWDTSLTLSSKWASFYGWRVDLWNYISRLCKSCSNGSQEGPTALVRNITLEPMPEFAWSLVSTPALLNQAHTNIVLSYTDVVSYVSVNGGDRGKFGWGVGSVWSYKTNKCSRALQVTCMYATKNVHQKTNLGFLSQVFE